MEYLKNGEFRLKNFSKYSYLYFPLCNHYGLKSSITPNFNGDMKTDQFHFALAPASNVDLLNDNNCRNVWFKTDDSIWNIAGTSLMQKLNPDEEILECGFLYQKVIRETQQFCVEVTSFVPEEMKYNVELHKVSFTNKTKASLNLDAFVAIPIYGRSADNIRDHRHVTALLNRVTVGERIITNKPTLSFDERGHLTNDTSYSVIVSDFCGKKPENYYPTTDSFMGEGGTLVSPKAVYSELSSEYKIGETIGGYEALGGFKYPQVEVKSNEKVELVFAIAITNDEPIDELKKLCTVERFNEAFVQTTSFWKKKLQPLSFEYGKNNEGAWLKWVTLQPILRRIYGCSFLPHHDYGKGGRGWRDLWQDCLALIKMDPSNVKTMLINNFSGTRIDGSNATIIGDGLGEFRADRNNIVRMWMDHGAWPLVTTKLYIENTNDIDMLFVKQPYFKDNHISFSQKIDNKYEVEQGSWQLDAEGNVYQGTILEHLLVANLAIYYNVGKHNNCRLMSADWNDGLDMAEEMGESVAFTALYAQNLQDIGKILSSLHEKGIKHINVFKELMILIDDATKAKDVTSKQNVLRHFLMSVEHSISGEIVNVNTDILAQNLESMYRDIRKHINENEWLESKSYGYYNGYYDNDSNPVENADEAKMILTGQVFAIMSGIASKEKIIKITKSADKLLYDANVGGYRLNTDYHEVKHNMGRLFGFAYGHKENGAVFSHMAVMYANALYKQGFAKEGYKVIQSIFNQVKKFDLSKTFPGIPEYFDDHGRGMYNYLTGSASWLILTMIENVFGIKRQGDEIKFKPMLMDKEFTLENDAKITTLIDGKLISVTYLNPTRLPFGKYTIKAITYHGQLVEKILVSQLKNDDEIVVILGE